LFSRLLENVFSSLNPTFS